MQVENRTFKILTTIFEEKINKMDTKRKVSISEIIKLKHFSE